MYLILEAVGDALDIFTHGEDTAAYEQEEEKDPRDHPDYQAFLQYRVNARSVKDFLDTYLVKKRKLPPKKECRSFFDDLVFIYENTVRKWGFCYLSEQDSITGATVSFYPADEENVADNLETKGEHEKET